MWHRKLNSHTNHVILFEFEVIRYHKTKKKHPSTDKTQNHLHMETIATQTIIPNKKKSKCLPWSERLILKISYAPFDTLFLFCSIFFRLICQTIVRHLGVLWPMIANVFSLTVSSLWHTSNVWQSVETQKKNKRNIFTVYKIQTYATSFFILSCTFFWHVFGFDMVFIVSFIMSWLLLMCLFFVILSLFFSFQILIHIWTLMTMPFTRFSPMFMLLLPISLVRRYCLVI